MLKRLFVVLVSVFVAHFVGAQSVWDGSTDTDWAPHAPRSCAKRRSPMADHGPGSSG